MVKIVLSLNSAQLADLEIIFIIIVYPLFQIERSDRQSNKVMPQ